MEFTVLTIRRHRAAVAGSGPVLITLCAKPRGRRSQQPDPGRRRGPHSNGP